MRRRDELRVPTHTSLTTPAVRMVVLFVWVLDAADCEGDDNDGGRALVLADGSRVSHEVMPVLALRSCVWSVYYSGNMDELPDEQHEQLSAVVFDPNWGLVGHDEECMECENGTYTLLVADWPKSEDEKRLAPLVVNQAEVIKGRKPKTKAAVRSQDDDDE